MKFILSGLYKQFIKNRGRTPNSSELKMLKKQAIDIEQSDNIIKFPAGGKDKISPFKPRPKKSLDEFKKTEDAFEQSKKIKPGVNPKLTELENIKKIKVENKEAAKRFKEKMNKNKTVEDFIKDGDYDPSGMAAGGLAGLLGEPRSEYGAGGGTGAPPITYGPPIKEQKQTPGISMSQQLIKEAQELEILKRKAQGNFREEPGRMNSPSSMGGIQATYDRPRGTFEGNSLSDFKQAVGDVATPQPGIGYLNTGKNYEAGISAFPNKIIMGGSMKFADGGRIGFKNGGMDRRGFIKLMGGLASIPVLGKFFKFAKAAKVAKVVPLKNTTTTMPAWFPDLVDKFVAKGVAKKIDEDMIEYSVKELPDVKLLKQDNGAIRVEGKNAYNEEYYIDYEPPGVELIDEATGKSVKTKGDFVATDTEYRMVSPEDYDIDGVNVDDIDELLGGSSNQLEGFAKGTGKTKYTTGQRRIDEADAKGASSKEEYGRTDRADVYDPYEGMDGSDFVDPEDFAKGGLAGMLGFQDGGRIGFDNGNIVKPIRKLPGNVRNFADIAANLNKTPAGIKTLRNLTKAGKFTGYGLLGEAAFAAPFALSDYAAGKTKDRILGEQTFGLAGQTEQEEIKEAVGERGYATQQLDEYASTLENLKSKYESLTDSVEDATNRESIENLYRYTKNKYDKALDNFLDDKGQFNKELYNQALNNYTAGMNQISKFDTIRAKERPDELTGLESYDVALAGGGLSRLLGE